MSDLDHGDATLAGGDALGRAASCEVDVAASTISDGTHAATARNATASDGPPATALKPEQPGMMAGADDGDTQQPPFDAMVRKPPKKSRASKPRDNVVLAWVKRVAKSVSEIEHSPEWPPTSDAVSLPARLALVREVLANVTAKAPRDFGLAFPGPVAQQTHRLLSEVVGAIRVRSMTRDGEERFWGELSAPASVAVQDLLRDFAKQRAAATPNFSHIFSPLRHPTADIDAALATLARTLLRYLSAEECRW